MHKPIDIRASSGSVSASFRSILLHSDQIKFQNEERLPAIRPLCRACLPLLSACRTGTHKHPVYVSKFIYLWFVLYYNILEQLKLYNGPCMLGLSFSLYPSPVPNCCWLLDGSLFGRIFRSFRARGRYLHNDILTLAAVWCSFLSMVFDAQTWPNGRR